MFGKTSTAIRMNAVTPKITITNAPTIIVYGLRSEKLGIQADSSAKQIVHQGALRSSDISATHREQVRSDQPNCRPSASRRPSTKTKVHPPSVRSALGRIDQENCLSAKSLVRRWRDNERLVDVRIMDRCADLKILDHGVDLRFTLVESHGIDWRSGVAPCQAV